jgi:hypothetical protein
MTGIDLDRLGPVARPFKYGRSIETVANCRPAYLDWLVK